MRVDVLFAEGDVFQEPSLGLFLRTRHAEMDASRVTVADGRNADLIQIRCQPAAFKLFGERKPLLGVLHVGLIRQDEKGHHIGWWPSEVLQRCDC